MRTHRILLVASLLVIGCDASEARDTAGAPCMYFESAAAQRYVLRYALQTCAGEAMPDLPEVLYDSVADWAFNARRAGVLAPLVEFKVLARLATLDSRHASGFSFEDGIWRRYAWAEWAKRADLTAGDILADETMVRTNLEQPFERAGIGKGHALDLELRKRRLDAALARRLRVIFEQAEVRFQAVPSLTVPRRTLEELLGRPVAGHPSPARVTLTKFSVLPRQ